MGDRSTAFLHSRQRMSWWHSPHSWSCQAVPWPNCHRHHFIIDGCYTRQSDNSQNILRTSQFKKHHLDIILEDKHICPPLLFSLFWQIKFCSLSHGRSLNSIFGFPTENVAVAQSSLLKLSGCPGTQLSLISLDNWRPLPQTKSPSVCLSVRPLQ